MADIHWAGTLQASFQSQLTCCSQQHKYLTHEQFLATSLLSCWASLRFSARALIPSWRTTANGQEGKSVTSKVRAKIKWALSGLLGCRVLNPPSAPMNPILTMLEKCCCRLGTSVPCWPASPDGPQHSHSWFPITLVGFTHPKPILVFGFPSKGSCWTSQGSYHPHQEGSLLPLLSLPQKGQSSSYPASSFHAFVSPQALSSSRSYSAVCIRSIGALCFKRWLGWLPHTPWKHLHLNLKGWVSDSKTSFFFWQGFGRSLVVIKPITFLAHCQKFHLHAWWQLVLCRC